MESFCWHVLRRVALLEEKSSGLIEVLVLVSLLSYDLMIVSILRESVKWFRIGGNFLFLSIISYFLLVSASPMPQFSRALRVGSVARKPIVKREGGSDSKR